MRFQRYVRKYIGTDTAEVVPFGPEDFKAAGVGYSPIAGMPILEAYQLVNSWNIQQREPRFVYGLELGR